MRWGYKTIHFSLKKDGILGNAFLDETEIEITLNEYGKSGWELISFMEVSDGLIAVFKQPFDYGLPDLVEEEIVQEEEPVKESVVEMDGNENNDIEWEEKPPVTHSQLDEAVEAAPSQEEKIDRNDTTDVGSIKIG
jgi:hypothetical protein